jgi:uncharacterized protein (TIGR00290 family)
MVKKILLSWGGGKDSAMALYELRKSKEYEVMALLTVITKDYGRISMHGVRESLLEIQARSLGIPLERVYISKNASIIEYEENMKYLLKKYQKIGINSVAFGDIFLEDVRKYREDNLAKIEIEGLFPLWGKDTSKIARKFIDSGFRSIITCVDCQQLDRDFVGREYDRVFLSDLPDKVDPCGEIGEFHSFVYDGPMFKEPIGYEIGKKVLTENRFYFCDLVPKGPLCYQ